MSVMAPSLLPGGPSVDDVGGKAVTTSTGGRVRRVAAAGIVLAVLLEQAVCRVPGLMRPSGKNCT